MRQHSPHNDCTQSLRYQLLPSEAFLIFQLCPANRQLPAENGQSQRRGEPAQPAPPPPTAAAARSHRGANPSSGESRRTIERRQIEREREGRVTCLLPLLPMWRTHLRGCIGREVESPVDLLIYFITSFINLGEE